MTWGRPTFCGTSRAHGTHGMIRRPSWTFREEGTVEKGRNEKRNGKVEYLVPWLLNDWCAWEGKKDPELSDSWVIFNCCTAEIFLPWEAGLTHEGMDIWHPQSFPIFASPLLLSHSRSCAQLISTFICFYGTPFPSQCGHHVYMPPKDGPSSICLLTNLSWGWTISVIPLAAISPISVKSGAQLRMTLNREMGNVHDGYMASKYMSRKSRLDVHFTSLKDD